MKTLKLLAFLFIFTVSLAGQSVSAPNVVLPGPSEFDVVISMEAENVSSYQFIIDYDPNVIQPLGDLSNNFGCRSMTILNVVCNVYAPGHLAVAGYSAYSISEGDILQTSWTTLEGNYSPLSFGHPGFNHVFDYWGRDIHAAFRDGSVTVGNASACTSLGC